MNHETTNLGIPLMGPDPSHMRLQPKWAPANSDRNRSGVIGRKKIGKFRSVEKRCSSSLTVAMQSARALTLNPFRNRSA